jgi:hypothetical protein
VAIAAAFHQKAILVVCIESGTLLMQTQANTCLAIKDHVILPFQCLHLNFLSDYLVLTHAAFEIISFGRFDFYNKILGQNQHETSPFVDRL